MVMEPYRLLVGCHRPTRLIPVSRPKLRAVLCNDAADAAAKR